MSEKTPQILISLGGIAVLAGAFALWCMNNPYTPLGVTAAIVSAALFAIACLRFVPKWVSAWQHGEPESATKPSRQTELRIFFGVIVFDVFAIVLVYALRLVFGYAESFTDYLQFWTSTDSGHYLDIARDWYLSEGSMDRLVQLVFLPGYPIIVRAVSLVFGDYLISGLLVSMLCYAGAAVMLYKLCLLDYSDKISKRAARCFVLGPAFFFFVAPMSESLFMLCALSCIYLVRTKKTALGCLIGAYAAFTRSLGIVLMVPVLFELVQRRAKIGELIKMLIIPLGTAAYLWINYRVSGDALRFMTYQHEHWNQGLGLFFGTAAYQTEYARLSLSSNLPDFLGLWLPNLAAQVAALLIIIFSAKKLRASYTAFSLCYYIIAIGATWLLSAPRYMAGLFALYPAAALIADKEWKNVLISALGTLAGVLYLCAFAVRWQVW